MPVVLDTNWSEITGLDSMGYYRHRSRQLYGYTSHAFHMRMVSLQLTDPLSNKSVGRIGTKMVVVLDAWGKENLLKDVGVLRG